MSILSLFHWLCFISIFAVFINKFKEFFSAEKRKTDEWVSIIGVLLIFLGLGFLNGANTEFIQMFGVAITIGVFFLPLALSQYAIQYATRGYFKKAKNTMYFAQVLHPSKNFKMLKAWIENIDTYFYNDNPKQVQESIHTLLAQFSNNAPPIFIEWINLEIMRKFKKYKEVLQEERKTQFLPHHLKYYYQTLAYTELNMSGRLKKNANQLKYPSVLIDENYNSKFQKTIFSGLKFSQIHSNIYPLVGLMFLFILSLIYLIKYFKGDVFNFQFDFFDYFFHPPKLFLLGIIATAYFLFSFEKRHGIKKVLCAIFFILGSSAFLFFNLSKYLPENNIVYPMGLLNVFFFFCGCGFLLAFITPQNGKKSTRTPFILFPVIIVGTLFQELDHPKQVIVSIFIFFILGILVELFFTYFKRVNREKLIQKYISEVHRHE